MFSNNCFEPDYWPNTAPPEEAVALPLEAPTEQLLYLPNAQGTSWLSSVELISTEEVEFYLKLLEEFEQREIQTNETLLLKGTDLLTAQVTLNPSITNRLTYISDELNRYSNCFFLPSSSSGSRGVENDEEVNSEELEKGSFAAVQAPEQHGAQTGSSILPTKALKFSSVKAKSRKKKAISRKGPASASESTIDIDTTSGQEILSFSYYRKGFISRLSLKCPVIDLENFENQSSCTKWDDDFKLKNCVYRPSTMNPEHNHKVRSNYKRECNYIGWQLAYANQSIRNDRKLIEKAVKAWRSTRMGAKNKSRAAGHTIKCHV